MKHLFCTLFGLLGSFITGVFGGWSAAMTTLVVFMVVDYLSGVIVAAVFHKSTKTATGSLKSWIGFKGLCKKGMILLMVLIAHRLDLALGVSYIREAVMIGFTANEGISIIENAGLMGIPLPSVITKAVEVLSNKSHANQ